MHFDWDTTKDWLQKGLAVATLILASMEAYETFISEEGIELPKLDSEA